MSGDINERFVRFLHAVELHEIRPMSLHSEIKGPIPPVGNELQLEWRQSFANDDPVTPELDLGIFRPKYEFIVKFKDSVIFKQESIFVSISTTA